MKYLSCAETAKLIRKALKDNFPGIKFSVRSKVYSGGASINIEWHNGPATPAVEKIAKFYEGASFDGSIDLKSYHTATLDGEEVHFGSDYVFCRRNLSRSFVEAIVAQFRKEWGYAGKVEIRGDEESAYAYMPDYYLEKRLHEILYNTDEKDMQRAYEAEKEAEDRRREEWLAKERAKAEQEAREKAEAEAEQKRREAQAERERLAREQAEFEKWCSQFFTNPIWDLLDMGEKKELYKRWKVEEEAKKKEAQKQAEEKARREQEQAEREKQQQEQARRERERLEKEQQEQAKREQDSIRAAQRQALASRTTALRYLGLSAFTTSRADIMAAWRARVKALADGKGGYKGDMDLMVKIKEKCMQ